MNNGNFYGAELSVRIARVVKYHAGYGYYSVTLREGGAPVHGLPMGNLGLVGSTETAVYPAGTPVAVLYQPGDKNLGARSGHVIIIGALQLQTVDNSLGQLDHHDLLGGVGYLWDKVHNFLPTERTDDESPILGGAGQPMDAVSGERSVSSPLGVGWLVGLVMAYLRASDRCGIWMFRLDEHLRMTAKSLEQQTLSREVLDIYDDGELSVLERVGAFAPGTPVGKASNERFDDPLKPPKDFPIRPVEVNQRSIFRLSEIKGYLGDLQETFVSLPISASGVDTFPGGSGAQEAHQGVFRQLIGSDGCYVLQSAKGIHLEKYPLIQLPVQLRQPNDPEGDTPENYKASGQYGKGEAQTRKDFTPPSEDIPVKALLGLAFHGAYISKTSLQTLRSHKKDWRVQDEIDTPFRRKGLQGVYESQGGFKVRPDRMWMDLPKNIEVPIQNGRWTGVRYYAGRSAIDMWDDGSVTVEDAWGSQYIMSGGNIVLTCPGDIIMAPGRSVITMAPQDIIQRAGNSVDITATKRDVTIKAEMNLKILGGNSDGGGVLVESRNAQPAFDYSQNGEKTEIAGLVLKSAGAAVMAGKEVSCIAEESLVSQAKTWHVASETAANLEVTGGIAMVTTGKTKYLFSSDGCVLGADGSPALYISGAVYTLSSLSVRGAIKGGSSLTCNGSATFTGPVTASGKENMLIERAVQQLLAQIPLQVSEQYSNATDAPRQVASDFQSESNDKIRTPGTYFNAEDVTSKVAVSLRTEKDYRTEGGSGFILAQWRWQQYMHSEGKLWEEKAVKGSAGDTYPWPGAPWLKDAKAYLTYSSKDYDLDAGVSKAGGEAQGAAVKATTASRGYLVNSTET
jgi:hypothetical protein